MPRQLLLFAFCFSSFFYSAQDSLYTRKVIKYLTSPKCYGRGYIKNGLRQAEKFLVKEIRSCQALPLFDENYTQPFYHTVNTFPGKCEVKINGKKLRPGIDFIPSASAPSLKGNYTLSTVDSVTTCS